MNAMSEIGAKVETTEGMAKGAVAIKQNRTLESATRAQRFQQV